MLDVQKRRVQLALFVGALIVLSMTAEKFRELVGEESSSKSGQFTFLNCFDMSSGTLACGVKEGVKLYVYSIRNAHVERARQRAMEISLTEALQGGLTATAAAKQAQKDGAKAAKLASRQAKRILGPIISSGWDFFEAIYYEGTVAEGILRGAGTLFGTYVGGFHGEQRLGKLGYYGGSHLGSWVGGRIGLMIYDVANGVSYLVQFVQPDDSSSEEGDTSEETISEYAQEEVSYDGRGEDSESYEYNLDKSEEDSGGWGLF
ncbi:uncharacterized protein M6B38_175235 [Iris pallida]|uniref:Uncharacterized protein n=1 Tax=Iris pallida TaxID=29817 RepID=A0AAX6EPV8_IRIPA|nr:uncharacterized protein M6B38_175235 [Iris pallida]